MSNARQITPLDADRLTAAAHAAGTPAFVYDADALRQRAAALIETLPDVDFAYSLKANPNVSIVRTIVQSGFTTEVCSGCEIEAALAAGSDPAKMLFVGPAKSRQEIVLAVDRGIGTIILESADEVALVSQVAARAGRVQAVGLRVNPGFAGRGAKLQMSGQATQFGIDEDRMTAAADLVLADAHLRLDGLHVYMGTRILDADVIVENTANILDLADRLATHIGRPLGFVDVGGGFGVPYADTETPLDLAAVGTGLRPLIAAWKARSGTPKVMIELGRYVVAEAGTLVTAVRYVKTSRGQNFAVCDGGSNCHGAAAQGASFRRNFPVSPVCRRPGETTRWSVSGPLCTPTDIIARDIDIPSPAAGDLLRIDRSGAYGPTASPTGFLSFGMPAEVLVDGATMTLIRERQTPAAMLAPQHPRALGTIPTRQTEKV